MSKKKIELCPSNNNFYLEKENVIITGLKDENTFIYQNKCKAQGTDFSQKRNVHRSKSIQ